MLWDATPVYPHVTLLLSCPCETVILCFVYPAPSISIFAPRSLIRPRLHLHFAPRSLITVRLHCPASPWASLPFLFCFPAQRRSLFFSTTHYRFQLAPAVTGVPPISGPAHLSVPVCNRKHKKRNVVTSPSLLHNIFLEPRGGECTVDRTHLRPQSTKRIPARVQNTNIHAHRQTLLRYRPRERVFESDFLSIFRHK